MYNITALLSDQVLMLISNLGKRKFGYIPVKLSVFSEANVHLTVLLNLCKRYGDVVENILNIF